MTISPGVLVPPAKEYVIFDSKGLKPLLSVPYYVDAARYAQALRRSGMDVTIYKSLKG